MKKLLAMVLALVMTLSLAVSANAAFKDDKSISDDYAESVAVLNGMGVFKGYEDGSFKPEGNITRAEVATIIYRIYTADVAKNDKSGLYATYNKFSDMAGAGWAQGYIGYCANASLVKGYPDGTFKPSGKVTGYEVLAMILRAVGYDKNNEFSGADWALHVAQTAQQLGVLDNVAKTTDLNAPASRELVAELLFQGIQKAQVTYTPAFGYVTDKVISTKTNSLGEKNFKLASAAAAEMGVKVEMNYSWLYGASFAASTELQTMASGWYENGTEVIFACGGNMFQSVAAAAAANDGAVVGVDVDQSSQSDTVITSAMKGLSASVQWACGKVYDGSFDEIGGTFVTLGAKDNAVGLPTATWSLTKWTVDDYNAMLAKMADGSLVVDNDYSKLDSTDSLTLNLVK